MIKTGKLLNLKSINVDIEDTDAFSRYFVVSELDSVLASGKNSLSMNGSSLLQPNGEIFLEAVDVNGKSLYVELASTGTRFSYREGVSIVYSIHVYSNTPKGIGEIIIVGSDTFGRTVRWRRSIEINPSVQNKSKVRFYKQPIIEVSPFINVTSESDVVFSSAIGNCICAANIPKKGTNIKDFDFLRGVIDYSVLRVNGDPFSSDMIGKKFIINGNENIIQDVITSNLIKLSSPIVDNNGDIINVEGSYIIEYFPFNSLSGTTNQIKKIGTAEIKFKNLETFTGKVYRYKIYRSSISAPYDSECIADGIFSGAEAIYDSETPYRSESNIGKIYSSENLNKHWFVNSFGLSIRHSPEILIDSFTTFGFEFDNLSKNNYIIAKAGENEGSSYVDYNYTSDLTHSGSAYNSNFIHLYKKTEYIFSCNIIIDVPSANEGIVDFYLHSSRPEIKSNKAYDGTGLKIASITSTQRNKKINNFTSSFYVNDDVNGTLMIYPSNSNITISNISIKPYSDFSFGPDTSVIRIPFDARAKNEGNMITCELFDIDHNLINSKLTAVQYFDPEGITYPYNISITQAEIDIDLAEINNSISVLSASVLTQSSSFSNRITTLEMSGGGGSGSVSSSIATTSSLGVIKVGNRLKIDTTGSLSVDYESFVWGG